jgi:predicted nucleic acid-binding protein
VILVDSNILIDIIERDLRWYDWSSATLALESEAQEVRVTPIVVAEVGPKFPDLEAFHDELSKLLLTVDPLTDEAAYVAGETFRRHRRFREGPKSILADFLIGGHAAVAGATILTRDPAIYAAYFPQVPLICPDKGVT